MSKKKFHKAPKGTIPNLSHPQLNDVFTHSAIGSCESCIAVACVGISQNLTISVNTWGHSTWVTGISHRGTLVGS